MGVTETAPVPTRRLPDARRRGRLRIAFAIDNLNIGGTELNAVRTAEALRARDVDVTLCSLRAEGPLRARYEAAGIEVHGFSIRNLYGPSAWHAAVRLGVMLRRHRIDVLHAHDMYTNVFAVPVARAAGVRLTVASRRWFHAPGRLYPLANRAVYHVAHRVIANAPALADLLADGEGIPRRCIRVVPNFVEPECFHRPNDATLRAWTDELRLPPGVPVIGCVANLLPVKDHATLLRAMAIMVLQGGVDACLVLVGDGPCRAELETLADRLGIAGHVRFAGRRPSQPSLHHLFDIAVLTSTSEGSPNTLLEAMAAARPVVATRVGAIPDLVGAAVGRLVPSGGAAQLAGALSELVGDETLRRRLGASARDHALRYHSVERVVDDLLAMYDGGVTGSATSAERGA